MIIRTDSGDIMASSIIDGIAVDPWSPPIEGVEHLRRTEQELALWRRRPYVVSVSGGWEVRCLDGLQSDRPTAWGVVPTLDQAISHARSYGHSVFEG